MCLRGLAGAPPRVYWAAVCWLPTEGSLHPNQANLQGNQPSTVAVQTSRDLEIQLKTEQVHIAPASCKLAGHRTAGTYRNYGERLYVEGRLDAMRKEQLVRGAGLAGVLAGCCTLVLLGVDAALKSQAGLRCHVIPAMQAQRVKEEEVRAELETLTFKPEISKMAQQVGGGGGRSDLGLVHLAGGSWWQIDRAS